MHLHTRLAPDFLPLLLPQLLVILAPVAAAQPTSKDADKEREKEDKERIAKQRIVLRLIAELALLLVWPEGIAKGAGEVGKIMKALVSSV